MWCIVNNYMNKFISISVAILFVIGFGVLWFLSDQDVVVNDFEECVAAGNRVMESYPRQCRHENRTFIEIIDTPLDDGQGDVGILPFDSGVQGRVFLGPTCPVVKDPPDLNCVDKPYKTTVQVIASNSPKSSPFVTVESDSDGEYILFLPPGDYALQAVGGVPFPRCETKQVVVEPSAMLRADLFCDTGIR